MADPVLLWIGGAWLLLRDRGVALAAETAIVSLDPPSGYSEKVMAFARAIAKAEGYGIANAIPTRLNNPGDLKISAVPSIGADASGHLRFATAEDGWRALYRQVQLIVDGRSRVYTLDMTIAQMGERYAEGSWNWTRNVTDALAVRPETRLREVLL